MSPTLEPWWAFLTINEYSRSDYMNRLLKLGYGKTTNFYLVLLEPYQKTVRKRKQP